MDREKSAQQQFAFKFKIRGWWDSAKLAIHRFPPLFSLNTVMYCIRPFSLKVRFSYIFSPEAKVIDSILTSLQVNGSNRKNGERKGIGTLQLSYWITSQLFEAQHCGGLFILWQYRVQLWSGSHYSRHCFSKEQGTSPTPNHVSPVHNHVPVSSCLPPIIPCSRQLSLTPFVTPTAMVLISLIWVLTGGRGNGSGSISNLLTFEV